MTLTEGFLYGFFGGLVPELWALYNLRVLSERPEYLKTPYYWVVTFMMLCAGGAIVCLYIKSGVIVNAMMAVHLGVSTPVLIAAAIKEPPQIN